MRRPVAHRTGRWCIMYLAPLLWLFQLIEVLGDRVTDVRVLCDKNFMLVQLEFDGPFYGTVFSHAHRDSCTYVAAGAGQSRATFRVPFESCGTQADPDGKFYENTLIVQHEPDIIEAQDEAKKIRCLFHDAYHKTVPRPPVRVEDLHEIALEFQGDSVDSWMEIQEGKGPWAPPLNGIVGLGNRLTLVISILDPASTFDMRVTSCQARGGEHGIVLLTDSVGCNLRPKIISTFEKTRDPNEHAVLISYANFYAFKFPNTLEVYVSCMVQICRHQCPDPCPSEEADAGFPRTFQHGSSNFEDLAPPNVEADYNEEPITRAFESTTKNYLYLDYLLKMSEQRKRNQYAHRETCTPHPRANGTNWDSFVVHNSFQHSGPRDMARSMHDSSIITARPFIQLRERRDTGGWVGTGLKVLGAADLHLPPDPVTSQEIGSICLEPWKLFLSFSVPSVLSLVAVVTARRLHLRFVTLSFRNRCTEQAFRDNFRLTKI